MSRQTLKYNLYERSSIDHVYVMDRKKIVVHADMSLEYTFLSMTKTPQFREDEILGTVDMDFRPRHLLSKKNRIKNKWIKKYRKSDIGLVSDVYCERQEDGRYLKTTHIIYGKTIIKLPEVDR